MKTLSFAKTSLFFKPIKVLYLFLIIQLSKNIRFIGICVETERVRMICAQTVPVGWLIP